MSQIDGSSALPGGAALPIGSNLDDAAKTQLGNQVAAAATSSNTNSLDTKTIVYKSEVMKQLMKMIDRVAPSNATILTLGESGTGKELVARAVHDRSTRRNKPFVAINCGAVAESLLESLLRRFDTTSASGE